MSVPMVGRGPAAAARVHVLDAVVVGAGGAGLYAALELKRGLGTAGRVGVVSKLYPTRSHTGAAQGGVCAALGNTEEDHWEWHWWDTVKGGDYLVDQDAAEVMCRDAVQTIRDLEHLGLPFDRTPEGLIDQRRFGGHSRNHGEAPVRRGEGPAAGPVEDGIHALGHHARADARAPEALADRLQHARAHARQPRLGPHAQAEHPTAGRRAEFPVAHLADDVALHRGVRLGDQEIALPLPRAVAREDAGPVRGLAQAGDACVDGDHLGEVGAPHGVVIPADAVVYRNIGVRGGVAPARK